MIITAIFGVSEFYGKQSRARLKIVTIIIPIFGNFPIILSGEINRNR